MAITTTTQPTTLSPNFSVGRRVFHGADGAVGTVTSHTTHPVNGDTYVGVQWDLGGAGWHLPTDLRA